MKFKDDPRWYRIKTIYDDYREIRNKKIYKDAGAEYPGDYRENTDPGAAMIHWTPMFPNFEVIEIEGGFNYPVGSILKTEYGNASYIVVYKYPGKTLITSMVEVNFSKRALRW